MYTSMFLAAQEAAPQPQGGGMGFLIMMVAIFAIMWFFMIRPQQKRQKEVRNFQNQLQEGTRVITGSGIYGTVKRIDIETNRVQLEIAKGVVVEIDKSQLMADTSAMSAKQPEK